MSAWEDAANTDNPPQDRNEQMDIIAAEDGPLILETHEVLSSYYKANASKPSPGGLKNTTRLNALATTFEMARSHHALGVEAVMDDGNDAEEGDLHRFEVAVDHHLNALKLASETSRLRAMSNILLLSSRESKRLTTRGRDLSVVSFHTQLFILLHFNQNTCCHVIRLSYVAFVLADGSK